MLHCYTYANLFREPHPQILGGKRGVYNGELIPSYTRNSANHKDFNAINTIKYRATVRNQPLKPNESNANPQPYKPPINLSAFRIKISDWRLNGATAVSYTHLTLPTICSV
eukprot:TRINITY_DN8224_c0_g1_i1.p1 TRINITY_DN8224_c0_g1~~TRINITY_DN8224_c0_g1_i1.p1  ORF type:complete len:111 (-),score=19.39 TRINITY_DN8224_c0_g1_i1:37-369(-)